MKKPKISVIMSVYKESNDTLKKSIESLLNQTFKDFELILVIDNPDNKETVRFVQSYESKDHRVKVLINPENLGVSASLNRALRIVKADWVARMDADDWAYPTRLEKSWTHKDKGDIIFGDSKTVYEGEFVDLTKEQREFKEKLKKVHTLTKDELMDMMLEGDFIPNSATMFKKELGLYDGQFRRCDDYYFYLSAINKGYKPYYFDEPILVYTSPYEDNKGRFNSLKKIRRSALEEARVIRMFKSEFKRINPRKYHKKLFVKYSYLVISSILYPLMLIKRAIAN